MQISINILASRCTSRNTYTGKESTRAAGDGLDSTLPDGEDAALDARPFGEFLKTRGTIACDAEVKADTRTV